MHETGAQARTPNAVEETEPAARRWRPAGKRLEIAGAFALIFAILSAIEFAGPAILDNDGYYHIRWSRMLLEAAPRLPEFHALPLTTLNAEDYVDHHFLYHIFLAPFSLLDMRLGAKLAAVTFASLGLAALFGLLVAYRVPYRWAWLGPLVAGSSPFLYRMMMTRAPALTIAMLGLGAWLILRRRTVWLAVLSFALVWMYSLFPLILVMAILYGVAVYLARGEIEWRPALGSAVGILAGMVINPYFPKNWALFYDHLAMKVAADYAVPVGVEWYPYESWVLVGGSQVAFALFLVGLAGFDYSRRAEDVKPLFFLLVSVLFLVMLLKSRRFVEYWPPFAVLFAAFTLGPRLPALWKWRPERRRDRWIGSVAAAVALVVMAASMWMNIFQARRGVEAEADPDAYRGASEWLAANTPPGTLVFNTDWDDFPMLFYYNPANAYVAGLDPTYLYDRDPELWKLYERVTLGREANPAPVIRERFGAEYVFTDNLHGDFLDVAWSSGDFETVYRDSATTVLLIRRPDAPRPD